MNIPHSKTPPLVISAVFAHMLYFSLQFLPELQKENITMMYFILLQNYFKAIIANLFQTN